MVIFFITQFYIFLFWLLIFKDLKGIFFSHRIKSLNKCSSAGDFT